MKEMVGGCCVCADDRGYEENPLVYCDGPQCDVAVHQGCYGILKVPEENWYCAKCSVLSTAGGSKEAQCQLCVMPDGALKRTSDNGWAHVICALYIPEVKFGDVHSMEPVILADIPQERFNKTCHICESMGRVEEAKKGACMHCNRTGCKKHFHVTCAQHKGLLCEEGGDSKNVKYCGYCYHHLRKVKDEPGVKTIPAFRPSRKNEHHRSGGLDNRFKKNGPVQVDLSSVDLKQKNCFDPESTPTRTIPTPGGGAIIEGNGTWEGRGGQSGKEELDPDMDGQKLSARVPTGLIPDAHTVPGVVLNHDHNPASMVSSSIQTLGVTTLSVSVTGPGTIPSTSTIAQSASSSGIAQPFHPPPTTVIPPPFVPTPSSSSAGPMADGVLSSGQRTVLPPSPFSGKHHPHHPDPQLPPGPSAVKRPRGSGSTGGEGGTEKPKRPRKTTKKTVKSLLESVSQVVDETVSSFQAERVAAAASLQQQQQQQRDSMVNSNSAMAAAAAGLTFLQVPGGSPESGPLPAFSTLASSQEPRPYSSASGLSLGGGLAFSDPFFLPSSAAAAGPLKPIPRIGQAEASSQHLPSTLEQLLERQWERGSQFLMEQSQHFDIASLLSCLHQLKSENQRLEKDILALSGRRDHLLAVNARLSIAYGNGTNQPSPQSPRLHSTATMHNDISTESSPTSSLSQMRSLATTMSPATQGSFNKPPLPQANGGSLAGGVMSPATKGVGVGGGNNSLGSSSGVFSSVGRHVGGGKGGGAEGSPPTSSTSFLIPRTPTPLLASVPNASMAALNSSYATNLTQEQQYLLLQHQQAAAAAAYNLAAASLIQPSTSPQRAASVSSAHSVISGNSTSAPSKPL